MFSLNKLLGHVTIASALMLMVSVEGCKKSSTKKSTKSAATNGGGTSDDNFYDDNNGSEEEGDDDSDGGVDPNALAQFVKMGNNGSESCNTFCGGYVRQGDWWRNSDLRSDGNAADDLKPKAVCVSAKRVSDGVAVACNLKAGMEVACTCQSQPVEVVEKAGNNGSKSCADFCDGTNWAGWHGACVGGSFTYTTNNIQKSYVDVDCRTAPSEVLPYHPLMDTGVCKCLKAK